MNYINNKGRFNGMYDSDPVALLNYLLPELEKRNLAFVEFKRHGSLEKRCEYLKDLQSPD